MLQLQHWNPTSLSATLFLAGAYAFLCSNWSESKHRAWIITSLAAGTAFMSSLPFLCDLALARGNVSALVPDAEGWRHPHAIRSCAIFQGYLVADLVVGAVHYRDQLNILTGWVHHVLYICLMQYILFSKPEWACIFGCVLVMELPTFILGLARLYPVTRNDRVFSASFLVTRILFHVYVISAYALRREWVVLGLFCCAFPLHAMWFIRQLTLTALAAKKPSLPVNVAVQSSAQAYSAEDDAAARALQSPPPELAVSEESSRTSTGPTTPNDDRPDPINFVAPDKEARKRNMQLDLHLLRHALSSEQSLRIRAVLAAASRGRYAALAARARGLYRDAQIYAPALRENVRSRVWGAQQQETALRREILVN
ncbi:hypothetical protein BKA62DRAFT_18281 [Auriculariales sp. MPI-PUGE-AT-0066]|nr:hypothetical protein BKA62DRAFT_18281 [Auriculariales sp. MPI-PUGE-AT-0066]